MKAPVDIERIRIAQRTYAGCFVLCSDHSPEVSSIPAEVHGLNSIVRDSGEKPVMISIGTVLRHARATETTRSTRQSITLYICRLELAAELATKRE